MLDFRVETFLKVCEFMNYTKAAEALHITQPAVTQHIHYLEREYDQKLFLYSGKKLELSEAGRMLCQAVTTIKSDLSLLKETMRQKSADQIDLHFGATMTIGEFVIAEQMKRMMQKHPTANFHMTVANTAELTTRLKENQIQLALVEGYVPKEEFDSVVYSTERFIPVCSATHKFTGKTDNAAGTTPSRMEDLLRECIIVREAGSGTREILESNLHLQNLTIHDFSRIIEVNGMHTIKSMISADCGISFLYETVVREELQKGTILEIRLNDFQVSHDFSLIWNKNSIYADFYRDLFTDA